MRLAPFSTLLLSVLATGAFPAAGQDFGPLQSAGSVVFARGLDLADLNGDGLLDLVVCNSGYLALYWIPALGGGAFAPPRPVMGARSFEVVTADMDGDGDLDVLATDYTRVRLAENLGGANFSGAVDIAQTPFIAISLDVGDLDGDGDLDLAMTWIDYGVASEVQVVWNEGAAGWSAPVTLSSAPLTTRFVKVRDCDGDGDADVVALAQSPAEFEWWRQEGGVLVHAGSFSCLSEVPMDHEVGDLDGDGIPDLVTGGFNSQTIEWHRGLGGGSFAAPELLGSLLGSLEDLSLADLDGDGHLDVLGTTYLGAACFWIRSLGGGAFEAVREITPALSAAVGRAIAAGDLDQDGDLDVVSTDAAQNDVRWLENLGAGTDCNGDGVLDAQQLSSATDCDGNGLLDACDLTDPRNDWNGDGLLDACVSIAYCTSAPNSTGQVGTITPLGTPDQSALLLGLRAEGLPPGQWCHFLLSQATTSLPGFGGSQGTLCVGAPIVRLNRPAYGEIGQTSAAGTFEVSIDPFDLPQGVTIGQGSTWHFQLWYRDLNPGTTSNTTEGVRVMFR